MPGSIGDDVPDLERVGRLGREARRLVDEQADAVPEAVAEAVAVAGRLDHVPGEAIRLDARHAGLDPRDGGELRLEADVVDPAQPPRQLAGRERAGAVGAVAVEPGAPVDGDERSRLDEVVARLRVRLRAVRARGDRRVERELVDPVGMQQLPEPPRELALAAADPGLRGERLEGPVGGERGAADAADLGLVLHRPEGVDDAGRRHRLDPARAEHLDLGVRNDVRLEGDAAAEPLGQVAEERPPGELDLDALDRLGLLEVAEVGEEADGPVRDRRAGRRSSCRSRSGSGC